jgi:hypothetical protein
MGEILGLGLSHYPGPGVPVQHWARMIERNVDIGRVKREVFQARERWPAPMLREWANDEGVAAATEHRRRLLAGYARLRQELDAFQPDFILIWGDDQYENFKRDCIPAFCLGIFRSVTGRPFASGGAPFKTRENAWGLPPETEMVVRGHYEGASALCRALIEDGIDVAYALEFRHPAGLAHSFNNTILYLDYDRRGFDYPVVPFHVNCYGNQLMKTAASASGEGRDEISPPAPSPARCFEVGRATARFLAASPWRVALIASSSWSHGSLTAKHGRLYPDIEADRARFEELQSGRFSDWGRLTQASIEESGQHEILNWVCLAGAMTELGLTPRVVDYVETYVFNSSKCFAYFPPRAAAGTKPRAKAAV